MNEYEFPAIRSIVYAGIAVIAIFFGGFGLWAAIAELESAAIAPGVLSIDNQRKSIQHLEGGIIAELRVAEGQEVDAGEVLIRLDQTLPRANLELLNARYRSAQALKDRLMAERDGREVVKFSDDLVALSARTDVDEIIESQRNIFAVRRQALTGQIAILQRRIEQFGEEIEALTALTGTQDEQIALIEDEIDSNKALFEQGLASKPRLRELQRESASISGERSRNLADIARSRQSIDESKLQIAELRTRHLNEVVEELRETQNEIYDLNEQIRSARDVLERTVIRTPLPGKIVGLQVHTIGGVIAPGQTLMDIVPQGELIIVEARVDPGDIDVVAPGLGTWVRLSAYKQRNVSAIEGVVDTVSADRLTDERTGLDYFLARVRLNGEIPEEIELYPGMQAEVMIVTGSRTLLDYLVDPISQSVNRALRET